MEVECGEVNRTVSRVDDEVGGGLIGGRHTLGCSRATYGVTCLNREGQRVTIPPFVALWPSSRINRPKSVGEVLKIFTDGLYEFPHFLCYCASLEG
jgi:hypothetical protein